MAPLARTLLVAACLPLPGIPSAAVQDEVTLHDGRTVEGRVLLADHARVLVRQGSREIELDRQEVSRVRSLEQSLETVLDHLRIVPQGNVPALVDLARVSDARGLPGVAALVRGRVLLADPHHVATHEALGHRRRGSEWTGPLDGKWFPWNELLERRREWNTAWELESTHYRVRTNLELGTAIDVVLDLERFYLFFFETIGAELGRRFVLEPMHAHLHGDTDSYVPLAGRDAWYDLDQRRLVVNATTTFMRSALFHEAVHQLLDVSEKGRRSEAPAIPAWISEGLAEYLAQCASGPAGRAEFTDGRVALAHAYQHARAAEPVGLTRFLALEYSDFTASEDSLLMYAQAYTLVHMCLNSGHGRYREPFLDFLRLCFEGRGNPSTFRELVATDEERFEADWTAYAKRFAGAPPREQ